MANRSTHKASKDIPYCHDQGIQYLCGAGIPGVTLSAVTVAFVAGGVYTFLSLGLPNMYNSSYQIIVTDQNTGAVVGVTAAHKTATGFTLSSGPSVGDLLDVTVIGRIKNQSGK